MPDRVTNEGQEVGENLTTMEGDRMSEKERNRASQLKNKCELIRPRETFLYNLGTAMLKCFAEAFLCVCVC